MDPNNQKQHEESQDQNETANGASQGGEVETGSNETSNSENVGQANEEESAE